MGIRTVRRCWGFAFCVWGIPIMREGVPRRATSMIGIRALAMRWSIFRKATGISRVLPTSTKALGTEPSVCNFPANPRNAGRGVRGWNHYWMLLGGEWIEQLEAAGEIRRDQPFFQLGERDTLVHDWFEESMRDAERGLPGRICARVPQLFYCISSEELVQSRQDTLMRQIAKCFEADPSRLWDYAELARDHGISYATLRRRFRRCFAGVPPSRFARHPS